MSDQHIKLGGVTHPVPPGVLHPDDKVSQDTLSSGSTLRVGRKDPRTGQFSYNQTILTEGFFISIPASDRLEYVLRELQRLSREVTRHFDELHNQERFCMPATMSNFDAALKKHYGDAIKRQLQTAESPFRDFHFQDPQTPKETPTMSFNKHTIYLTDDQEARARSGEMKRAEALSVITEGFLPEIVLSPGDVVRFVSDYSTNEYEVVRIEDGDMIVRRLAANSSGPAGETHVTSVSKYQDAIRNGKAVLNPEDD